MAVINKTSSYKDLSVYKKAYEMTLEVYRVTKGFPDDERYGLVSQLKRCSVSVPSNIAEGYRRGRKEYIQFLKVAFGSSAEMETQTSISFDPGYVSEPQYRNLYALNDEVSKLLRAMIRNMEASQ